METQILARKVDETQQKSQYIHWLNHAHNANIMLYSRDKTSREIARAIRPEFSRILVVNEYKDAARLIDKFNHNPENHGHTGSNHHHDHGIDLILADADYSTPKILEHLQKRAEEYATGHLPVISVVLLMSENIDPIIRSVLMHNDFSSICVNSPFNAATVLDTILEVLHRRHVIETTYKKIRKKTKHKEFPYIPVFADVEEDDEPDLIEEHGAKREEGDTTGSGRREGEGEGRVDQNRDGSEMKSNASVKIDLIRPDFDYEIDDWIDCPTLLPRFIQQLREQIHPLFAKGNRADGKTDVAKEKHLRRMVDRKILKNLTTSGIENISQNHHTRVHSSSIPLSPIKGHGHALNSDEESQQFAQSNESYSSGSDVSDTEGTDVTGDSSQVSIRASNTKQLADMRLTNRIRSVRNLNVKSLSRTVDIRPFIDKVPPDMSVAKTVVGLNKKVADECWQIIHDRNAVDGPTPDLDRNRQVKKIMKKTNSRRCLSPSVSARAITSPNTDSRISLGISTFSDGNGKGFPLSPIGKSNSLTSFSSKQSQPTEDSDARQLLRRGSSLVNAPPKNKSKAIKTVKKMAAEIPLEGPMHALIVLDVEARKISAGEWVYLEQGLRWQEEGDMGKAITSFTRAIKRSRQPQLPMLCRGTVYFIQKNYLAALNEFTAVIKLLRSVTEAQYDKHDDFLAKYNRGIIHFCVGEDKLGVADVKSAINLDLNFTDHGKSILQAHTTLATALRRLGHFDDAINEIMTCRKLEVDLQHLNESRNGSNTYSGNAPVIEFTSAAHTNTDSPPPSRLTSPKSPIESKQFSPPLSSRSYMRRKGSFRRDKHRDHHTDRHRPVIEVEIKHLESLSIRDRKALLMQQQRNSNNRDSGAQQLGHLDAFKTLNGIKRNLFDTLFVRPTSVQEALVVPGSERTRMHLECISSVLRNDDFFHNLSDAAMIEMASLVEYRTVHSKGRLFNQNEAVEIMCFVLSGRVQMKLELSYESAIQSEVVGQALQYEVFGHMDLLFNNPDLFVYQYLRDERDEESSINSALHTDSPPRDIQRSVASSSEGGNVPGAGRLTSNAVLPTLCTGPLPRAFQAGSFMSHNIDAPTELLLIPFSFYKRWLILTAGQILKERVELLTTSGVFTTLPKFDLVRLVRSSLVKKFHQGDIILKQGVKPKFLYIVMKGLCRVVKRPTRAETILRKLTALKEQIHAFDSKYSFHHMMRGRTQKAGEEGLSAERTQSINVTNAEVEKYKIEMEIESLQDQLIRAKSLDAKDEEAIRSNPALKKEKDTEICVLKHPQIFGEACVLDPVDGVSQGTIIADTGCEILTIHNLFLQTVRITENVTTRVRDRAVFYPEDDLLIADNQFLKDWTAYKNGLVQDLHGGIKASNRTLKKTATKVSEPMEFSKGTVGTNNRK
mmetsp:Transcript_3630/g.3742  ORF Transcript_3630/g.3742 Transcript_3630/m.3742 type:complete len:1402 (+) Transcript_3630:77-4282(+)